MPAALTLALALPLSAATPRTSEAITCEIIAPRLDPAKVSTLIGDQPIHSRLYKVLYWLEAAHQAGGDVSTLIDAAQVHDVSTF